jgi:hypothetical protein
VQSRITPLMILEFPGSKLERDNPLPLSLPSTLQCRSSLDKTLPPMPIPTASTATWPPSQVMFAIAHAPWCRNVFGHGWLGCIMSSRRARNRKDRSLFEQENAFCSLPLSSRPALRFSLPIFPSISMMHFLVVQLLSANERARLPQVQVQVQVQVE